MRLNSMALGLLSWTLAVSVPAIYTAVMTCVAIPYDKNHIYTATDLMGNFNSMPVVMWIYMIAMATAGLLLVLYGLTRPSVEEELSV